MCRLPNLTQFFRQSNSISPPMMSGRRQGSRDELKLDVMLLPYMLVDASTSEENGTAQVRWLRILPRSGTGVRG